MELLYFVSVSTYKIETCRGKITWKIKDNAKKPKQNKALNDWDGTFSLIIAFFDRLDSVLGGGKC